MRAFDVRRHRNAWAARCAAAEESWVNKQREGKIQAVTVLTGEASLNNTISGSLAVRKETLNRPQKLRNFQQTSEVAGLDVGAKMLRAAAQGGGRRWNMTSNEEKGKKKKKKI